MSIYINDVKKGTVRHYCTTPKIDKAIETLLREMEEIVYSETHEGYEVIACAVSFGSCINGQRNITSTNPHTEVPSWCPLKGDINE